jgi:hypothetical protein
MSLHLDSLSVDDALSLSSLPMPVRRLVMAMARDAFLAGFEAADGGDGVYDFPPPPRAKGAADWWLANEVSPLLSLGVDDA